MDTLEKRKYLIDIEKIPKEFVATLDIDEVDHAYYWATKNEWMPGPPA